MDWTDEAIARLRALWDEGHSTAEIGRRLGISKNAVVGKAHRLNLPPRPSPIRRTEGGAAAPRRAPVAPVRRPAPEVSPVSASSHSGSYPDAVHAVQEPTQPRPRPALQAVASAPRSGPRTAPCCWPIGEPGTPDFHFCGADAMTAKPYCTQHAQLAYVKVRDRREDAA